MKKKTTVPNKTLFLVIYEPFLTEIYKTKFAECGFEVESIPDGGDAAGEVRKMQEGKREVPDFALIEFSLPNMSGTELAKLIRSHEKTKNLPLFILTGWTPNDLIEQGIDINAERYISKTSYTPSELVELAEEMLGEKKE